MNQARRDLGVFDFSEEDEVTNTYPQWSKVSNPNRSIAKNQLSHCGIFLNFVPFLFIILFAVMLYCQNFVCF